MTRRELRENVFMMLFRVEFHNEDEMPEQLVLFEEELENLNEKDSAYINHKCNEIFAKLPELDAAINETATGWKTTRMAKVDLSIIRLAVYEMKYEEDIDAKVSINEAVELAKKYGADESASFVNGVLAKFL
ncbi:MAG: transcription antitermination factor NusB [Lachnospiraceae bacterium]|nr:transcription antitermination factor NusB [Lachnospiraceae bacterium]